MMLSASASLRACVAAALLCSSVVAQASVAVGYYDHTFSNPSRSGPSQVATRVYYPARWNGPRALMLSGRFASVVLLPGFGRNGIDYADLATEFSRDRMIIIVPHIARTSDSVQMLDAIALYHGITKENDRGPVFKHRFDKDKRGIVGHSMGASSVVRVLADNPGFEAGVCFGPWINPIIRDPRLSAPSVRLPILIVAAEGDRITPWRTDALPIYEKLDNFRELKSLYLLNDKANHSNLVAWRYAAARPEDRAVFDRSTATARAFLSRYVRGNADAIEGIVGRTARAGTRLKRIYAEVRQPQFWQTGTVAPGRLTSIHALGSDGPAAFFVGYPGRRLRTTVGDLHLDPRAIVLLSIGWTSGGDILSADLPIPREIEPQRLRVQGVAAGLDTGLRFSKKFDIVIKEDD